MSFEKATGTADFSPFVEEVGTVKDTTLGATGWAVDGNRYMRTDGKCGGVEASEFGHSADAAVGVGVLTLAANGIEASGPESL